ncbi:MAG: SMC-Scp complex subunit ScpB [Alphaproteobacteria bacterium]|nr:SMC-Scp complex subunit ScpB [Alphaproteobacteria bacterium]
MTPTSHIRTIEALLFMEGGSVPISLIKKLLQLDDAELQQAIRELTLQYQDRGIVIINDGKEIGIYTHPDLEKVLTQFEKTEKLQPLSPSAQETLSVIAYIGPIKKNDLDFVRGVNTQFIIRRLLTKGFIHEEKIGREREFSVSNDFLRHMGVTRVEELPEYNEIHTHMKKSLTAIKERLLGTGESQSEISGS